MFGMKSYIIGAIGLFTALAIAGLVLWGNSWKNDAIEYRDKIVEIVTVTKEASGNEDVTSKNVVGQIRALGESNKILKYEIEVNNRTILEMSNEAVRLKADAARLQELVNKAKAQRKAALDELSKSKLKPGTREDCMTLLQEAEDALDLLREAAVQSGV